MRFSNEWDCWHLNVQAVSGSSVQNILLNREKIKTYLIYIFYNWKTVNISCSNFILIWAWKHFEHPPLPPKKREHSLWYLAYSFWVAIRLLVGCACDGADERTFLPFCSRWGGSRLRIRSETVRNRQDLLWWWILQKGRPEVRWK